MTRAVRAAVRDVVADGARPLVLGGCCALVPGALAGLRDAVGALGVAYVDGHVDVYDGATSPTGEGADMPMSVAFGLGPDAWVRRRRRRERRAGRRRRARRARPRGGAGHRRPARRDALADVEVLGPDELRAAGPRRGRCAGGAAARAPTAGASGSTSTSTCSTSARCRRRTTSCPTACSGTSSPRCMRPLGRLAGPRRAEPRVPEPREGPRRRLHREDLRAARRRPGAGLSQTSRRVSSRSRSRSMRRMISSLILPTLRRRMISARSASSTLRRRRW